MTKLDSPRNLDLVAQLRHRIAELEQPIEVQQTRTREHLELATAVHRSLLPAPVRTERAEMDVRYQPVDGLGGDYCQIHVSENVFSLTVCDVTGHNIGASLLATRVSSEVRRSVRLGKSPAEIVDGLNRFVYENFSSTGLLLTFFAARLDLAAHEISWSGAGHPSPILVRGDGRKVARLASQNLIIGVLPHCLAAEPEHRTRLEAGDRVLFYTDGVTEVFDATGFGTRRGRPLRFHAGGDAQPRVRGDRSHSGYLGGKRHPGYPAHELTDAVEGGIDAMDFSQAHRTSASRQD